MGSFIRQKKTDFFIPKENKEYALVAIKSLYGNESITPCKPKHFPWINSDMFLNADSLNQAMLAWRWKLTEDNDGNIIGIRFTGEKLGADILLFNTIAPYVKPYSFIEIESDNCSWRYVFEGDACLEIFPGLIWSLPNK